MTVKWPKSLPAELRTGWGVLLTAYWWLWSLVLPDTVKRSLYGLKQVLDTPTKVQAWLWANVRYTPDKTVADDWQKAERTFERRAGDCLPYDTMIPIVVDGRYNLLKIGDIVERGIKGLVPSFSPLRGVELKKINSWQAKGKKRILHIKLKNGRELKCTDDHVLFTMDDEGNFSEVEARGLRKRSTILGLNGVPALNQPAECPDLLWLEGLYVAEGWHSGGKTQIGNKDPHILRRAVELLSEHDIPHALHLREKDGRTPYITIRKCDFREHLNTMGGRASEKHFLPEHLSLPKEDIEILLDGYRDGDGYKNPKRLGNCEYIYATTSSILIKQLVFLHNIIRRPLHIEYREDSGGAGENPLPIWRGYYFPYSHFTTCMPRPYGFIRKKAIEKFPNIGTGTGGKTPNGIHSPQIFDYLTIRKLAVKGLMNEGVDLSNMKWAIGENTEWFKVKSIERVPPEETYDIGVEGNHNFLLWNDLLVHNCEDWAIIGAYLLTRRYKLYYLCMYTEDSGHATLLVDTAPGTWDVKWSTRGRGWFVPAGFSGVSVGTYGLNRHDGRLPDIVKDWHGFRDWTTAVLMDEGLAVLEVWYMQRPGDP